MTQATARIAETRARIKPLDQGPMERAEARQNTLTKPHGSLGRLEELSIQLASMTGRMPPQLGVVPPYGLGRTCRDCLG